MATTDETIEFQVGGSTTGRTPIEYLSTQPPTCLVEALKVKVPDEDTEAMKDRIWRTQSEQRVSCVGAPS